MVLTMNSNSVIQKEKDRGRSVRRKRRRDLRSMLGPTWSSQELLCFYDAYRKYGTDWLKVGAELHEVRTKDMLEALYNMNKAYLSLQEGIATVGGFIAIVVDRCKVLEESDGDQETDGAKEGNLATIEKQQECHQYGKQHQSLKQDSKSKAQVNDHLVSSSTANGDDEEKTRCDGDDEEKTRSYSKVPETREQISRPMHQHESTSSHCRVKISVTNKVYKGIAACSKKPKRTKLNREDYRVAEQGNHWRRRSSVQVSNPEENNRLRKLIQEDERVGIACEALLNLSMGQPKAKASSKCV